MRDTNLPEQNNTSTQQKSKYEQKYEQKARKKVNRKATLALLTAVFTLIFVLLMGTALQTQSNAAAVEQRVQDQVKVQMDELLGTPPMQEIMNSGTLDAEVIKDDVTQAISDTVLSPMISKKDTLSASDVAAMESRIREAIERGLGDNLTDQTVIQQLEQSLGLEEGDLFSEEWFLDMLTNVFSTTIEQTIYDTISSELDYVYEDINILADYIDENLNNIYNDINNQQTQIDSINTQIDNIKETMTTLATKEEVDKLQVELDALNTELIDYKAQTDLKLSYLENTMAANYDELKALIESNTARIEELEKRTLDNMSDTQSQINNIVNEFNTRI